MIRLLIDTDTASDDAVALVLALTYPQTEIVAITTVSGNVPLNLATQNALYTLELCNSSVPVYAGADRPLLRPLITAQHVHGQDGMGDIGLPLTGRHPAHGFGPHKLVELINAQPDELTLVTLGPLTNIALALLQDASLAKKVKECIVMGGIGNGWGNITPVAEYNIFVDPEAARIVFESGMPLKMVGWDISRTFAYLTEEEANAVRAIGTPLANFCIDIQKEVLQFALHTTQLPGFDLPDPIAMAVALNPEVATDTRLLSVEIETISDLCRGQTVVDHLKVTKRTPNVSVVLAADRALFLDMLRNAVRPMPS
jgi:purine nucleosidase